jgi:glycerophosphoryl diester phosphodiesterase
MTANIGNHLEAYGHRGARFELPENTLAGFEYTISLGADGFEFDLNITKDNVIVISHDQVLHGPICKGPTEYAVIHESTLQQLKMWDCGGVNPELSRQKAVPGERIPTLDEVFALAPRGDFRFLLEAKSATRRLTEEDARRILRQEIRTELTKEQEDKQVHIMMLSGPELTPPPDEYAQMILDKIREYHLEKRVGLLAIDYQILYSMRRLAPEIQIIATYSPRSNMSMMDVIKMAGPDIVLPVGIMVTAEEVLAAHKEGVKVIAGGNRRAVWESHIAAGVDGIASDAPSALIEFLKSKGLR